MAKLHYLTVQDVLWINLQVTKKVNHYNFARLEEATYGQYALTGELDLNRQSNRLLTSILKLHPFEEGNESTAVVAAAAFFGLNGGTLNDSTSDFKNWIQMARDGKLSGSIIGEVHSSEDGHSLSVKEAVTRVLNDHESFFQNLRLEVSVPA